MTAGSGDAAAGDPGNPAVPATPAAPSTWNVANLLTILRLVLVPLFVVALFVAGTDDGAEGVWRYVAAGLFLLAALTDNVDGWVARRYDLITDFGKIADPIADKALIGAALVGLSILGELPWWVTIVIAARELGVTLLRFWVIRYGVIPASRGGKAKTLAQVVAIFMLLLPLPGVLDVISWGVLWVAVALTVATGLDYLVRAVRLRLAARHAVS
ncbi:CDP-diacylglycerol--glycerol-3-phosphate 3-phosphatidyltransferase [Saccharomonospora sp. CUA-673]|uniref:CDP-diacylglycerol--glycerol-3-phosphate 3-phosphatidyltransferase n=1 Tax=Saccharomonospora sp. CUA-673 TaxID=1904969 RepID=UPI00095B6067|nr:CDP-diacylglycerol--glycerol-3-phosphate 3-phosphatidyltransferase [Saccharomonospora sp. CUA-673]OLT44848.1 CDP-diacylglycerol--glycerol-3-phosphate 3-phosphatidyltransferase [Saccharomonospora sp. CUA-673]